MNRDMVSAHLRQGGSAEFATKDATGSHWIRKAVFLDDDGDPCIVHPTDPRRSLVLRGTDFDAVVLK